jgi:predicted ATPase/DNA-binding CsgD family transcriptional regulator
MRRRWLIAHQSLSRTYFESTLVFATTLAVLIGRDRELGMLRHALENASQGVGSCWMLAGEAGIGKSRLVEEIKSQAASQKFTILQGNCFEQSVSFPYAPWIDALRALISPLSGAEIRKLLGPLAPELIKLLPELALLIPSLKASPALEPVVEKYRLFEAFARLGSLISGSNPVLFVLEDLHWADALSLELIQYLVHRMHAQSLLFVGTYRNEEMSPDLLRLLSELNRQRSVQELTLKPLNRDEVEHMARALLESRDRMPSGLVDALLTLTDGNPFFIEETLKDLTAGSHFEEILQQRALHELYVPHTIRWTVQQRFEHLSEETRRILMHAAVIGQRFDFGLLQETTAQDEQQLLQALGESIAAHLVVQESAARFAFKHALTRDAVYSMSLLRERKAIHRAVGEALDRSTGTRSDMPAAQPAYHFYQAGVWHKAMEYSERAGTRAQALYAPREAAMHFTYALDAAREWGSSPPRLCLRGRAQANEILGEFDRARIDYEGALELARKAADRADEWQSLIDLGFLWQSRALGRSGEYFESAYTLARSLEETALIAESLNHMGYWHAHCDQLREAVSDHQQALELFRQLDDRRGMARTLELLGLDSYVLGDCVQGAHYCEQAVPMLRELDDRQGLANALTTLSFRQRLDTEVMGEIDLHQFASLSEEALEISHSCDYRVGEAAALHEGAACLCRAGEYGRGWEYLRRALGIAGELEHRELLTSVHHVWGTELYLGLLSPTEAREHLEAAHVAAQERGSIGLALVATASLVRASILQNDLARAQSLIDGALGSDLPAAGGMTTMLRGCWAARAELELALGNPARALKIVERLLLSTANLAQYGPHSVPRLSHLRGQALVNLGRTEEAVIDFRGALDVSQRQGQRALEWRLHADLGKAYRRLGRRDQAEEEFSAARAIIQDLAATLPEGELRSQFMERALAGLPGAHALTPRQTASKKFGGLTGREREVAELIAEGKSNREIAEALVVTVRTVEAHITRILDKLGFKSRTEIAAWAVAKGLARIPGGPVI